MMCRMSVKGQVVVITGGARGVGRYVARTFAQEGARVAIADIGSFENVEHEIEQLGGEALTVSTDVTSEAQVRALMDKVYKRFGRIDVLINDAGIVTHFHEGAPRWSRIRDMDLAFFQKVMNTNLGGTFLCTKHALPYMESLNGGHIINFGQGSLSASNPGRASNVGSCVYNTSKISIRAFTRSVAAEECEFNICLMSMGPGSGAAPRAAAGPGVPGGGGGIITDDSPEWSRARTDGRGVESVGNRYVLAAEASMEFSGHQVEVRDGRLAITKD
jgi:3-oxoacyl-[acyl-carrier protein] reductase